MQQYIVDILRLSIWLVLLMAFFIPIERLFSQHKQKILRNEFFIDLAYYFINSLLPKLLLVIPISLLAYFLHSFLQSDFYIWMANMPVKRRLLLTLVVGEFGTYWGHRWSHEVPFLWRFHSIHHSATEMDWLVNTRAHPLDMFFTRMCGLIPIYLLGLAQPSANEVDMVPILYTLFGTVWSFVIHANVCWRFGFLEKIISTPAFHHWHHTNDSPEYIDKNYAAIFPWMDKIFGSFYLPKNRWPEKYGIDAPTSNTLVGQLLQPLEVK
jgi:sterol desaturase/sphingolipid hydroxylase (fatty acid hydroxylase superfamily)